MSSLLLKQNSCTNTVHINDKVLTEEQIKEKIEENFSLSVETDNCPYYLAKMVKDIKIGESPDFIKKRLIEGSV